jgi:hypothetical protein
MATGLTLCGLAVVMVVGLLGWLILVGERDLIAPVGDAAVHAGAKARRGRSGWRAGRILRRAKAAAAVVLLLLIMAALGGSLVTIAKEWHPAPKPKPSPNTDGRPRS